MGLRGGAGLSAPTLPQRLRVVRVSAEDTVLTVVRGVPVGSLDRLYAPVLGGAVTVADEPVPGVHLHVTGSTPPMPGDVVVWGTAWSTIGPATDADVLDAFETPAHARRLTGRFVLAGTHGDGVRLVTSADVVHTLKHVAHAGTDAWSTRGVAALTAAGRPVEVQPDAIAEMVVLDFVLGRHELAAGVEVVDEANAVDVTAHGWTSHSYWPRADRLAPGEPTTPAKLRRVLTEAAVPVTRGDGAYLALTAGRDSLLVASCLADAGVRVASFTMGDPSWSDGVGARAVAAGLGWAHRDVVPATRTRPTFDEAVRWAPWAEGQVLGRDLVGPGLAWPDDLRVTLSGSGGEIGRAFWWSGAPGAVSWGDRLFPPGTPERVVTHVRAELDGFAGDDARRLDSLYAFGRMRKWLGRGRPVPGAVGTTAAYLAPTVVRALLDLPHEARADGSGFDAGLAAGSRDLRAVAVGAVAAAGSSRSAWTKLRHRLRPPVRHEVADLGRVLAEAGNALDPVRLAVGDAWWDHAVATAATSTRSRLSLWNAVSVAAFVRWSG